MYVCYKIYFLAECGLASPTQFSVITCSGKEPLWNRFFTLWMYFCTQPTVSKHSTKYRIISRHSRHAEQHILLLRCKQ